MKSVSADLGGGKQRSCWRTPERYEALRGEGALLASVHRAGPIEAQARSVPPSETEEAAP